MKERAPEKNEFMKNSIARGLFAAASMTVEVVWIILMFWILNQHFRILEIAQRILALVFTLSIYGMKRNDGIKYAWIMLILAFPLMGTVFFVLTYFTGGTKKMRTRYAEADSWLLPHLSQDKKTEEFFRKEHIHCSGISEYIYRQSGYPVYHNSKVRFFGDTMECIDAMTNCLKLAKNFIFMEYHAIEDAEVWKRIHPILQEKVKEGVEVRIFYDDIGSLEFLTPQFQKRMEAEGIRCRDFNRVRPIYNIFMNNRDHRKVTVIDGQIGFTGGFNLADEYVNIKRPYGEWKDSGVMLFGEAVQNLTVSFLEMWNADEPEDEDKDRIERYLPKWGDLKCAEGYVQPYADNPLDDVYVGENVYVNILNHATRYAYFSTPYLIPTPELIRAFTLAAERGVDVRIFTPGVPDKKIVYAVTKSYYHELIEGGVKIYQFTPGFIHAKQCVSDDEIATCGTINLDYRSFYHHFENGCIFYHCGAVHEVYEDFQNLMKRCTDVTEKFAKKDCYLRHLGLSFLRLFASLM